MKRKSLFAGACMMACALVVQAVELPLIWKDEVSTLKVGEKSIYLHPRVSPVKSDKGEKFVTIRRCANVLQCLPQGSVFGDYELRFSFRPKARTWRIRAVQHSLLNGSRRFRKDTLFQITSEMRPDQITVTPHYDKRPFGAVQHMTTEPRLLGADLPPFPPIEKGEYAITPAIALEEGKQWIDAVITVDQSELKFSFNGKTVAVHPIHPASGTLNLSIEEEIDVKGFEIRALRLGVDPYAEENLLLRQSAKRK